MEHDLLPEAQFPFENGKALLHENWDFVARWYLGEYYEGSKLVEIPRRVW